MYPKKLMKQVICNMDEPIVHTQSGKLRGRIVDGTYIFRGIKYADAKRFHMPEKVKPWEGVKEAIINGTVCCEMNTLIPYDEGVVPHYFYPQDENCQYLNIWTQHTDRDAKKPVMVWIHGGSFNSGSSIEQFAYDGENLSKFGDVVVVSLNHRLNVLGFLNLSRYGEQYKNSGNLGILDIVMALKWIRDNIAAFGGDPDNVTLFGQSGGGGKITTLLQTPAADGLYHKAMILSGVINGWKDVTIEVSQKVAELTVQNLGIDAGSIGKIESVPYYKLARAASKAVEAMEKELGRSVLWGPVFDNETFLGHPLCTGFREENKNIPIVIGSVMGEFSNNYNVVLAEGSKNSWSNELKTKLMKDKYGKDAEKILEAFKKAYPEKNTADVLFIDKIMRKGNIDFMRLRAKTANAGIYCFMFSLECPINDGTLPWHCAELPYLFHNAEYVGSSYIPGVTEWLQEIMSGALIAFAKTGNPNHSGMPDWARVQSDNDATMVFDREIGMRYGYDKELMELLPEVTFDTNVVKRPRNAMGGGPRQSL